VFCNFEKVAVLLGFMDLMPNAAAGARNKITRRDCGIAAAVVLLRAKDGVRR